MLHTIGNVVKSLIVIIILASFIELILPENKFQPYIKLVVGLVIIVTILNPLLQLFRIVPDLEMEILRSQVQLYQEEVYVNSDAVDRAKGLVVNEYKRRVQGEIEKVVDQYPGLRIASIELEIIEDLDREDFGKILFLDVALTPVEEKKEEGRIFVDSVVIEVGGEGRVEKDNQVSSEHYRSQIDGITEDLSSSFSLEKDSIELFVVK